MSLTIFLDTNSGKTEGEVDCLCEQFRKHFKEGHLFSNKEELLVLKEILGVKLFFDFVDHYLKQVPDSILATVQKCGVSRKNRSVSNESLRVG